MRRGKSSTYESPWPRSKKEVWWLSTEDDDEEDPPGSFFKEVGPPLLAAPLPLLPALPPPRCPRWGGSPLIILMRMPSLMVWNWLAAAAALELWCAALGISGRNLFRFFKAWRLCKALDPPKGVIDIPDPAGNPANALVVSKFGTCLISSDEWGEECCDLRSLLLWTLYDSSDSRRETSGWIPIENGWSSSSSSS